MQSIYFFVLLTNYFMYFLLFLRLSFLFHIVFSLRILFSFIFFYSEMLSNYTKVNVKNVKGKKTLFVMWKNVTLFKISCKFSFTEDVRCLLLSWIVFIQKWYWWQFQSAWHILYNSAELWNARSKRKQSTSLIIISWSCLYLHCHSDTELF